jgi:hypothetical protein
VYPLLGRGKTQEVSPHPRTVEVPARTHKSSSGIYGGQSDITKDFLREFRTSPPSIIQPQAP